MPDQTSYSGPAVIEIMGHRRIAGLVSEVTQFGVVMCRIDVPKASPAFGEAPEIVDTQFYPGSALFSVHPCSFIDMMRDIEMSRPVRMDSIPDRQPRWDDGYDPNEDDHDDDGLEEFTDLVRSQFGPDNPPPNIEDQGTARAEEHEITPLAKFEADTTPTRANTHLDGEML